MHSLTRIQHFLWLFAAGSFVSHALASSTPFYWGFPTISSDVATIQECARLRLFVQKNGTTPLQPPYYLFAYEANGIPTATAVGSDPDDLWWTVNHASGSHLILTMTDSQGISGGVPVIPWTVTDGDNSCLPSSTPPCTVTTNNGQTINTCGILSLNIRGGVPPYKMTVAALSAPSVFNVSVGNVSECNWTNKAPANHSFIATISDAMGQYCSSTPFLTTIGPQNQGCNGTNSGPSNSSGSSSSKASNVPMIAGLVAGLVLFAILVAGLLFFLWKRDRMHQDYHNPGASSGGYGRGSDRSAPDGSYTATPLMEGISSPSMAAVPNQDFDPAQKTGPLFMQSRHNGDYGQYYSQGSSPSIRNSLSTAGMQSPMQPADHFWRNSAAGPVRYSIVPAGAVLITSPTTPLPPGAATPMLTMAQQQQVYSPTWEDSHGPSADIPPGYVSPLSMYNASPPLVPSVVDGSWPRPDSLVSVQQQPAASGSAQAIRNNPGGDDEQDVVAQHVESVPQWEAQLPNVRHNDVKTVAEELPPSYRVSN